MIRHQGNTRVTDVTSCTPSLQVEVVNRLLEVTQKAGYRRKPVAAERMTVFRKVS